MKRPLIFNAMLDETQYEYYFSRERLFSVESTKSETYTYNENGKIKLKTN